MKKISTILIGIFIAALQLSCDDDVLLKTDFVEKAVVYGMIDVESSEHKIIVQKNFEDKTEFNNDLFVEDATVKLISNNDLALLTLSHGKDGNEPQKFYYTDNFLPNKGVNLSLRVELPNGNILSSEISPPSFTLLFFEQEKIKIPLQSDNFTNNSSKISWIIKTKNENIAFRTYFFIDYYYYENDNKIEKRVEIPIAYIKQDNNSYPIYPDISQQPYVRYYQNDVETTLFEISKGDTTGFYTISGGAFELYIMEENIAKYLSTTEAFQNQFSIKVYEPEVGNIEGGLGLFGAYIKRTLPVEINPTYLKSLGFSTDLSNNN